MMEETPQTSIFRKKNRFQNEGRNGKVKGKENFGREALKIIRIIKKCHGEVNFEREALKINQYKKETSRINEFRKRMRIWKKCRGQVNC